MAEKVYNVRILQKQDSTDKWNSSPVILRNSEIGIEVLDNGKKKIKIGDGTSTWTDLDYLETEAAANILDGIANGSIRTSLAAAETADYRIGTAAFASGQNTKAQGNFSKATNFNTIASGGYSSAEGRETQAKGSASHAGGYGTIAGGKNQTVIGKFNIEDTSEEYAFIIGDGENADSRTNLFTVAWDGEVQVDGKKLATEEYVGQNGGKIDSISVNGSTQTITNKNVNITVPTKTSEITNDSNFSTVSQIPTKTSQLTNDSNLATTSQIPTKVSQLENDKNYLTTHQDISGKADKTYVDSQITEANKYTDDSVANLLNNSSEAVDSIFELRDAMEDNKDAIDVLTEIANTQSDWNQNNIDAKDYIKNRPFYTIKEQTIFSEQEITATKEGNNTIASITIENGLAAGEKYQIIFDDKEYSLLAYNTNALYLDYFLIAIGSNGFGDYTEYPFGILQNKPDSNEYVLHTKEEGSHTLSIIKKESILISNEFLEIDWKDIKNKPFESFTGYDVYFLQEEVEFENGSAYVHTEELIREGDVCEVIIDNSKPYIVKATSFYTGEANLIVDDPSTNLYFEAYYQMDYMADPNLTLYFKNATGTHNISIRIVSCEVLEEGYMPLHRHEMFEINNMPEIELDEFDNSIFSTDIYVQDKKVLVEGEGGAGEKVEGKEFTYFNKQGTKVTETGESGAEVFNNYGKNIAIGSDAHAEGYETKAIGVGSHAENSGTWAIGVESHAEGHNTQSVGIASHSEGWLSEAIGNWSHAEGYNTEAPGSAGHSEGYETHAIGEVSHAEGQYTRAEGDYSHAEGYETVAVGQSQHVQGQYNIVDEVHIDQGTYLNIVGNGTSDSKRSNAHTLDWDGNAWFAGDVYVSSTSGTNKDEGSKKLATEEFVNQSLQNFTSGTQVQILTWEANDQ